MSACGFGDQISVGNTGQRKVNQIPLLKIFCALMYIVVFQKNWYAIFPKLDTSSIFGAHHMVLVFWEKYFEKNLLYGEKSHILLYISLWLRVPILKYAL
jgi:hypothetical protein